ncbi:hypothetical protein FB567DRAFT_260080 [Paraphoma chrysanthemicola]|uniref:Uncharacterized protein n=1 Tax=Paraphoma chrysanthemicola TaxID=798071 RepID=A0A8K0QST1_9PLEO|nr:hypothetical protein FB567DRAFT_260080 [Paraphoma chrysanthemicola]
MVSVRGGVRGGVRSSTKKKRPNDGTYSAQYAKRPNIKSIRRSDGDTIRVRRLQPKATEADVLEDRKSREVNRSSSYDGDTIDVRAPKPQLAEADARQVQAYDNDTIDVRAPKPMLAEVATHNKKRAKKGREARAVGRSQLPPSKSSHALGKGHGGDFPMDSRPTHILRLKSALKAQSKGDGKTAASTDLVPKRPKRPKRVKRVTFDKSLNRLLEYSDGGKNGKAPVKPKPKRETRVEERSCDACGGEIEVDGKGVVVLNECGAVRCTKCTLQSARETAKCHAHPELGQQPVHKVSRLVCVRVGIGSNAPDTSVHKSVESGGCKGVVYDVECGHPICAGHAEVFCVSIGDTGTRREYRCPRVSCWRTAPIPMITGMPVLTHCRRTRGEAVTRAQYQLQLPTGLAVAKARVTRSKAAAAAEEEEL